MSFVDVIKNNPFSVIWRMASEDTTIEPSDEDALKSVLKSQMNGSEKEKKGAAELLLVNEKNQKWGESVDKRQENDIVQDVTDRNDFRNDEAMKTVNSTGIKNTPANELENNPRAAGGRERDSRTRK
jgi:hypothetical protein